ncbi:hypothetical protein SPURM210S_08423 [Streptomyces purpurascens]
MEDRHADAASGAWNPITATGTSLMEARRLADDAVHGIRLALREAEFTDGRLVHRLLVHELRTSVDRAFGTATCTHAAAPEAAGPYAPPGTGAPGGPGAPLPPEPPRGNRRGLLAGCAVWLGLACTCQMCCGTYQDPWTGERKEGQWVRSGDWPGGEWLLRGGVGPGSWFGSGGHDERTERTSAERTARFPTRTPPRMPAHMRVPGTPEPRRRDSGARHREECAGPSHPHE